ncbi:hypothetical protein GCM10007036_16590 [Alsobacter metallidurans]|uniref:Uncharacterized protein n=1 Tax=Alsobacter metallidurans TaxID=340221 RepID=A0A917I620_9HYPH|nr:hypothetical protein [Alsobacter metallidurans]GGH16140.1 hypothetical protein GCM10007036_16590 [Alsobacter metallidurans]
MTDDAWSSFTPAPAADPWASFTPAPPATVAPKANVAVDMAKSFGTGAALRQPASVIGAPRDVAGLITGPAMDGVLSVGNQIRSLLGLEPTVPTPAQREGMRRIGRAMTPNMGLGGSADVQKTIEDNVTGEWHKPQTTAGQYAQTLGDFTGPGAIPARAARAAPTAGAFLRNMAAELTGNVVAPALLSETAGQLTHGTSAEPWARVLGAAAGNVGTAAMRSAYAPENVVRRATGDMTDAQWQRARELAANPHGVRLTGPEAIAQATGGASGLPNVQRVVEGSVDGRARSGPFFAARPGQVDDAVGQWLNSIAPQSSNPSQLGPKAASAAGRAIEQTTEGQALIDAVLGTGPRTTPMQAGAEIQAPLRQIFDRRSGMRDAIGDAEYTAARAAEPRMPVADIQPETVRSERPVYSIRPTAADEAARTSAGMAPVRTDTPPQPVAMESLTGPSAIQVDPRPFMRHIDEALVHEKGPTADALSEIRQSVMGPNGVDTSVTGLDNLRGAMNARIAAAKQVGDGHTAEKVLLAQKELDRVLESVPEYARARTGFQAGSAPLEPFENPAVSRLIERDAYDRNFTTTPENVPATLEAGGPTAARAFNEVAPANARVAYENYLSTKIMDSVTDANGVVNPDRLALALRDNQDLLSQYPAVAERLAAVPRADAGLAGVRAGPLGQVSRATTTQEAGATILPHNPMSGSGPETADAVARLLAQDADATRGVVRQNLADRYGRAATDTMEGNREFAGAKFRNDVAGSDPRREVLDAVLNGIPGGPAASSTDALLEVLQATGRRKPIGSATEFNRSLNAELGDGSLGAQSALALRSLGTSLITNAADAARRATMRRSIGTLADMFLDQNSVDLIRAAAARGAPVNYGEAIARTGGQIAQMFEAR